MKLVLCRQKSGINAWAEYNHENNEFVVKKGSIVSENVSHSDKFRSVKTVERLRDEYVKNRKVLKDVGFKSSSTAANFVTGVSTNGMQAWKDEEGNTLKSILSEM